MALSFQQKIARSWVEDKFVCLGLDPKEWEKLPFSAKKFGQSDTNRDLFNFCISAVDATHNIVAAYKPNVAFFERYGSAGWKMLEQLIAYIKDIAPDVPIILDAKRGDIGATNEGYAEMAFDQLKIDAITISPYLGFTANEPFLRRADKGIFVLCKTSNPGSAEFQDFPGGLENKLYLDVASHVANPETWNKNGNCGLVVGATYPEQLAAVRKNAPELPILIPGIGTQGGDLQRSVQFGKCPCNRDGFLINVSSGALYASMEADYTEATRQYVENLNVEICRWL